MVAENASESQGTAQPEQSTQSTQPTPSSASNVVGGNKNKRSRTSGVWDHFQIILNLDGSNSDQCYCLHCNQQYTHISANGTTTLNKHRLRCKKNPENFGNQTNTQTTLDKAFCGSVGNVGEASQATEKNSKFDPEVGRKLFTEMIIVDELPFKYVEREGFRKWITYCQPKFKILSRTTIARDCLALYQSEKKKLKHFLVSTNQRVSLTTDLWTSGQNLSYICLTAHFIDREWKLHKRIIGFNVINSHKGYAIGGAVESCLKDWGINNVMTLTVDNAGSNDTAVAYLKNKLSKSKFILDGEFFHVRCSAHILNLIVRDGINEVASSISNIREAVKYIRGSPQRAAQFKAFCDEEGYSTKCALVLDVATRWNSTYLMLETALKFQRAFDLMAIRVEQYKSDLGEDKLPSEVDWDNARVICKFLGKFYEVTKKLSGSLYVTSNMYLHEVCSIEGTLNDWASQSSDSVLKSMATKMRTKFQKYWGSFQKVNYLLLVAVLLDPRFKDRYIRYLYKRLHTKERIKEISDMVVGLLKRLHSSYQNMNPESSNSTCGSVEPEVDQATNASGVDEMLSDFWREEEEEDGNGLLPEVEKFLREPLEKNVTDFDVLQWWKNNSFRFPILSQVARDVLAIPVSTVASESAFSVGGRVLDQFRTSLTPKLVEALICAQDWLRSSTTPIDVEERMEELVELEGSVITEDRQRDNNGR